MSAYSPWSLLPAPVPSTVNPDESYFYHNVVKHLIPTTIQLMNTGLPIDLNRVEQLEIELDAIIAEVHTTLAGNTHIQTYLQSRYSSQIAEYQALQQSRLKPPSDFLVPFDPKKLEHRSYFMHFYATAQGLPLPADTLPTGISKWTARDVQKLSASRPILQRLISNQLRPSETDPAMQLYAQHKADLRNKSTHDKINTPTITYPTFNPSSPIQKGELFTMLGLKSEATSKTTGSDKWDRSQLERLLKESTDPILTELLQALIDFSFAAIVRNNFIEAFYNYTVDGRLHGSYKLFGALSFRFTSSSPNMLNAPSTGSRFAKPIKKCFIAPEGYLVAAIDFASLEDRVLASLTNDMGKCEIYEQDLDSHAYNCIGYYPDEVSKHMALTGNKVVDAREFMRLVNDGNKELKAIRQKSKPVTFKCAYLGMPDADKGGAITEEIYNNYHKVLYPSIMQQVNDYILPTLREKGKIHLGLGCYLKSDNPDRDVRSVNNALNQFWSILSLLTMHKLNIEIDAAGYTNDIFITSSVYDSIYLCVKKDATIIKWLNDNIIPIMTKDFVVNQRIKNLAALNLGTSWADVENIELPVDADLKYIETILSSI